MTTGVSGAEDVQVGPQRGLGVARRAADLVRRQAILVLTAVIVVVFSATEPHTFPTVINFQTLLFSESVVAVLALAVLIPAVVGEFDLSVGYVLGFTSVIAAATGGELHLPGGVALILALAAGVTIGLFNGLLVTRFKISSLIATLGVGLAVSGFTIGASGSQTLSTDIPALFADMTLTSFLGLQLAVWLVVALGIVIYYLLACTPLGQKMYAVGGSERAARLAGIQSGGVKIGAFVASGLLAACAGAMELGQAGAADPTFGENLLLPAFAAIFLGATTVRPGHFNLGGTLAALVFLAVGFSGLTLAGIPFWTQNVFNGAAVLVGVLLSRTGTRKLVG